MASQAESLNAPFDMSQHAWLLAPLRDLSDNWDVDLAGDLNEYLDTLAELEFTFDGGDTTLNFAEAALLIQGSACVYSKKVEYLHALVYHALEVITSKKKKAGGREADEEDADAAFFEDEEHFLNLDDVLEEADDIDLDELRARHYTPSAAPRIAQAAASLHLSGRGNGTDGRALELMMSNSFIHHSGALLLEKGDLVQLDGDLRPTARDVAEAIENARDPGAGGDEAMNDFDDDGDAGAMDFDMGFGDDQEMPAEPEVQIGVTPTAKENLVATETGQDEEDEEDTFDPYAALDPYDASGMQAKPFKKGSTRLARRVQEEGAGALNLSLRNLEDWQKSFPSASLSNGATFRDFSYAFDDIGRAERKAQRRARQTDLKLQGQQQSMFADADADPVERELEDAGFVDGDNDFFAGEVDGDDGDFDLPNDTIDFEMPRPMEDLDAEDPEVSYEALCRQHIDRIIAAAAAEEVRSELAQRVSVWQNKIDPVLRDADSRPPFDIRVYKTGILHTIETKIEEVAGAPDAAPGDALAHTAVAFRSIVDGAARHEVCRLFAATLQLMNEGNINILHGDDEIDGADIELELRTPVEAFRDIDSFLAPSAQLRHEVDRPTTQQPPRKPSERMANVEPTDSPAAKAPRLGSRHLEDQGKENSVP